jgi:olfactory receptor
MFFSLKFRNLTGDMMAGTHSTIIVFIVAEVLEKPELQLPFLPLFLGTYVVILIGNLGVVMLIFLSSHLHAPMYYFLISLSFIDLCHSTIIILQVLVKFVTEKNVISNTECLTQLYFFVFIVSECYMLAAIAYACSYHL